MPAKTTKSIANKLKAKIDRGLEKCADTPVDYGGVEDELPPGIEGGVAQLTECKLGEYASGPNQGEAFFFAQGVIVHPEIHTWLEGNKSRKARVAGRFTRFGPEPLCDTPNNTRRPDFDAHIHYVRDILSRLGAEEMLDKGAATEDLVEAMEVLKEARPHFRFRTWKGTPTEQWPNPRLQEQWGRACEWEPPSEEVEETAETDTAVDEDDNLTELAKKADEQGDEAAARELTEQARKAGLSDDDVRLAESWTAVVKMINSGQNRETEKAAAEETLEIPDYAVLGTLADEEEDEGAIETLTAAAEEAGLNSREDFDDLSWTEVGNILAGEKEPVTEERDGWVPEVGEVYFYKPPKARKRVECEVLSVTSVARQVQLRNLDDGESEYNEIPWGALSEE